MFAILYHLYMIFVFNSFFVVCFVFNGSKVRKEKQVWEVGKENWPSGEPLYTLQISFPQFLLAVSVWNPVISS